MKENTKEGGPTTRAKKPVVQRDGTTIQMKFTFFPEQDEDKILYYSKLHSFDENQWVSFGIKPKAKDLKSVVEDLNRMEFLKNIESYTSSIALDGRKVRIGFESEKLDPFYEKYAEQGEALKSLSTVGDKTVQLEFEFTIATTQKLETIL